MSLRVPRRGDIWWGDFADAGRRPAVIVTSDALLPRLTNVTVVTLTTRVRGVNTEVAFSREEHGLDEDSVANCNNIITVPKASLIAYISHADLDAMNAIADAIHIALDLEY